MGSSSFLVVLILCMCSVVSSQGLSTSFYQQTCPNLVSIVTQTIRAQAFQTNIVPPSVLRLFFHDCMVQGCDASILISSTPDNQAERDAFDNLTLAPQAFNSIVAAKEEVEKNCPGIVSCSDILALAARDVVVLTGGPSWNVPLGRRDGTVSKASQVAGRLPLANFNVAKLIESFGAVNLSKADMVVLSGGHTIGFAHCNQFSDRLYNFGSSHQTDPSMSSAYARFLELQCPRTGADPSTVAPFDPTTSFKFDNVYYQNLQSREGLLFSDEVLFMDESTRDLVNQMSSSEAVFFANFQESMVKLSSVGVLQGTEGEIRRDCSRVN